MGGVARGYNRGRTPQNTPRYARGYIYLLWGSLGYLICGRKISPNFFSTLAYKIVKNFLKIIASTSVSEGIANF